MKKIIFLGDSITDARHCFLENPLGNGYVNMVAEKLNDSDGGRKKYDIMNRGHDGFTIHGVKRILEKECILKRPDVVSILIGCNDVGVMMNTGKSLEEILPLLTENPANLIKIADHKGFIADGMDADLVVLDPDFEVFDTFLGGRKDTSEDSNI